jgi:hypothetical protein
MLYHGTNLSNTEVLLDSKLCLHHHTGYILPGGLNVFGLRRNKSVRLPFPPPTASRNCTFSGQNYSLELQSTNGHIF